MDTLLDRYLKGELTEEQFNSETGKLSPDDKSKFDAELAKPEVQAKLVAKGKEELEKITALRKERARIDPPAPTPPAPAPKDFSNKMREENVKAASDKFFSEYEIPEAERQHYLDLFQKNDSGHVNVDLIVGDFTKIYAAEHSTELLNIRKTYKGLEHGAEDFNGAGAGGHGGGAGGGGGNEQVFSPEVLAYVKEARKQGLNTTPEQAKKVLESGMTRVLG